MKLLKSSAVLLALVWLSGCTNPLATKESEADLQSGEVAVEDRNAESSGIAGENAMGADLGDGAEAQVIVGEDAFQGNELDDPASPLSNRIVYFEYDSSSVRAEDQQTLAAHATYLSDNTNVTIRLEGHTDERGSREYNLALGERRALAIRQILMLHGASINQFEVVSFGEERLAVEGSDDAAGLQNRRVELIYVGR
ncbi:peptidoglycan-associated lipoprotein [Methylophaga sp. 42_8_T64]|nr:peptidoglycan-associated lipoprotein [Methylophaga sp. 41_12_T18]OUR88314.1 peptidoglycan-associated lipoprotein [Methylophaga sp. 42_8_T64]